MSNILTIPAGADFLHILARGLLSGDKILGSAAPESAQLHKTILLLPTHRAIRQFKDIMLEESANAALMLPVLLPLGDVEGDLEDMEPLLEPLLLPDRSANPPAAISRVERHVALTALMRQTPIIKNMDSVVEANAAANMAYELARFIDLTDRHETDRSKLSALAPERFAEHWQIMLEVLNVIIKEWPGYLNRCGLSDPIERRNFMLRNFAAHLQKHPPEAPVIIAGSTGSLPATGFLLKMAAQLKRGAIILPGLDLDMDENDWDAIEPAHPQYGLKNLLADMDVSRNQVKLWDEKKDAPAYKARIWLAREALRPAETTDCWIKNIAAPPPNLDKALSEITLVEAGNMREEAGIIALMLRENLERKNETAALITHDRILARRTAAMLKIWGIHIDDAAGVKPTSLPAFIFMKLIAETIISDFSPISFLSCVKHPLAGSDMAENIFRQNIRKIELCALHGAAAKGLEGIKQRLKDKDLRVLMSDLEKIFAPLAALAQNEEADFIDCLKAHILCAEALAAGGVDQLWGHEAGQPIADHLRHLMEHGAALKKIPVKTYPLLFEALFATAPVFHPRASLRNRLHIWSPLEARLQAPDLVILGGLNESVWPGHIAADPWLNRAMREDLSLPPPEAQTGQAAHDFSQLLAAPRLIVTRAVKGADGSPQQASRWLLRLQNMLQGTDHRLNTPSHWADILYARQSGEKTLPARRPQPKPPAKAKPKKLSASALTILIADPYAFYAERILKLKPLAPIEEEPTAAERGLIIHDILKHFADEYKNRLPDDAEDKLIAIGKKFMGKKFMGKKFFAGTQHRQIAHAFWMPRFEDMAKQFIELEKNTLRKDKHKIFTEIEGKIDLSIHGEKIILTARADRIDMDQSGHCAIYDYKTGHVPARIHVAHMNEPQLPLEALIALKGGFASMGQARPKLLAFIELKASSWTKMLVEIPHAENIPKEALKRFHEILETYLDDNHAFQPSDKTGGDYDHLARIKAWRVAADDPLKREEE